MGFVDHHQVVVAPVDTVQGRAKGFATGAAQVGMAEHIVVKAVFGKDVGFQVAVVVEPVVRQFFRAEQQYRTVA